VLSLAVPVALLAELVLCILHCQLWLPAMHAAGHGAHHALHAHHGRPLSSEAVAGHEHGLLPVALPEPSANCLFRRLGSNNDAGLHIPPSPVRDALALTAILLLAPLLALARIVARRSCYSSPEYPPQPRPPLRTAPTPTVVPAA
jgi:hypothetical protein